jgi:hypothetical protein
MGAFQRTAPPVLPRAPAEYNQQYENERNNILRLYFAALQGVQGLSVAGLNINLDTLPTAATADELAALRLGDVYRDDAASNILKIKI